MPRGFRDSLEDLYQAARNRNGSCLATTYARSSDKVTWRCERGHAWTATWHSVKRGTWCPHCPGSRRVTPAARHAELGQLAQTRGGKLLSPTYRGTRQPLRFACASGHTFERAPERVLVGSWCPSCADRRVVVLQDLQQLAAAKGARCLARRYEGSRKKLTWLCPVGHRWLSTPDNFSRRGCPECFRARCTGPRASLSLNELQQTAESRGGRCLAELYIDAATPVDWACGFGHQWKARPADIRRGGWCPICRVGGDHSVGQLERLAAARGGRCLTRASVRSSDRVEWQCALRHRWAAKVANVLNGTWCPACRGVRRTLDIGALHGAARRHDGMLISTTWQLLDERLRWRCRAGHKFAAPFSDIEAGNWCPECWAGL